MNKFFAIVLSLILSLPVCVWAVDNTGIIDEEPIPLVNTLDEDRDEEIVDEQTQYKQPISRRKIMKKFLAAMGGVAVSSFAIFFLLTVYNRCRESYYDNSASSPDDVSLSSPKDLENAVKKFLNKTNW